MPLDWHGVIGCGLCWRSAEADVVVCVLGAGTLRAGVVDVVLFAGGVVVRVAIGRA